MISENLGESPGSITQAKRAAERKNDKGRLICRQCRGPIGKLTARRQRSGNKQRDIEIDGIRFHFHTECARAFMKRHPEYMTKEMREEMFGW